MADPISPVTNPNRILPGTPVGDLADLLDAFKKVGDRAQSTVVNQPLQYQKMQLEALSQEQTEALQESLSASRGVSKYTLGSSAMSLVHAAATILGGAYLKYYKGEQAGDAFIWSGAPLLLNACMTHFNGWGGLSRLVSFGNKPTELVLGALLPIAATLFTYAWQAYDVAALTPQHKDAIETLEKFSKYLNCILMAGQIYYKFRQGMADLKLLSIESEMNTANLNVQQIALRRSRIHDVFDSINKGLRGILRNFFNTNAEFAKN